MILNKIFAFVFLVGLSVVAAGQTVVPGGYVSGIWDTLGSPYMVEGPVFVHEDSALNIRRGVRIEFSDSAYMEVAGMINAQGFPGDSIFFVPREDTWQGIRVLDNDSLAGEFIGFYHCSFSGGAAPGATGDGGAISAIGRQNMGFTHCSFTANFAEDRGGAAYFVDCNVQMKSCTFSGNRTGDGQVTGTSRGGALYFLNGTLTLEYVYFYGNNALVAGALYTDNSDLNNYDGVFAGNVSKAGGGAMVCHNGGLIAVDDTRFESNTANGSGGAVALLEAIWARFRNCKFYGNTASSGLYLTDGGAVLITPYDNEVSFINCELAGNSAGDYGGGIYATSLTKVINCLFYENRADTDTIDAGGGGAISFSLDAHQVINSTFSNNFGGKGSTILAEDTRLAMLNTILWDDSSFSDARIYLSKIEEAPEIFIDRCDIEGGKGSVRGDPGAVIRYTDLNMDVDPLFEVPGIYFGLSNESPCIDTGRMDTLQLLIPQKDINGNPRIYRGVIDLGCYENQFPFSIAEHGRDINLPVFPNPATNHVMLGPLPSGTTRGILNISDLSGKVMTSEAVYLPGNVPFRYRLPDLPDGLYILSLTTAGGRHTAKLIIHE